MCDFNWINKVLNVWFFVVDVMVVIYDCGKFLICVEGLFVSDWIILLSENILSYCGIVGGVYIVVLDEKGNDFVVVVVVKSV